MDLKLNKMENKEIFKVGDTVHHYEYGKGQVIRLEENAFYPVRVNFDGILKSFTKDGRQIVHCFPTLSFTPYDLVNGGFSQGRPLPDIEVDTLVYVRFAGGEWRMRYFSQFREDGYIRCFNDQQKSTDTSLTALWDEWSLTNPLEEK